MNRIRAKMIRKEAEILEMNDIVSLFVNNGVAVAVIIYFMIRDYKFISQLTMLIQQLTDTVKDVEETMKKFRRVEEVRQSNGT